ncbi:MAG: cobalamin-dependent protein, partial [Candidatus Omnitrophica bacterium]|nr:cobalamin-dependent protein [Candidatus Omnitrophota bacterium]
MKVLFLIPPVLPGQRVPERVFGCTYGQHPFPVIFVLQVAAVLEQAGIQVQYLDAPLLGFSVKKTVELLRNDASDVVCFFTVNLAKETDLRFAHTIRALHPKQTIIFFGPAATFEPESFLIDAHTFVVRGEPEDTFKELAQHAFLPEVCSSVRGISCLKGNNVVHNEARPLIEDLDALPFPARHLVASFQQYYNPKLNQRPFTVMLTSRGCPYHCRFCVPCSLNFARELEFKKANKVKPPVRMRSADNVSAEIRLLKSQGYRAISFIDDQFIWDTKRLQIIGDC